MIVVLREGEHFCRTLSCQDWSTDFAGHNVSSPNRPKCQLLGGLLPGFQDEIIHSNQWLAARAPFLVTNKAPCGRSPKCLANRWRKGQSLRDSPSPSTGDLWRLIIENGAYHPGKVRRYGWCIYMEMTWVYMEIYRRYIWYISIMEIYGDDTMGSDSTLWGLC